MYFVYELFDRDFQLHSGFYSGADAVEVHNVLRAHSGIVLGN